MAKLRGLLSRDDAEPAFLHDWRDRILRTLLMFIAVLGGLTAIPSIWLALRNGLWPIALLDVFALAWVLLLWRHPRLPFRFRAWNLLALIYLIGLSFLFVVGPVSQIYLMAFPVMAALLWACARPGWRWPSTR